MSAVFDLEGDEVFYVIKDGNDYKATFDQVKEAILKEPLSEFNIRNRQNDNTYECSIAKIKRSTLN